MKDIHYQIEFFTEWHCGSGLAAGADVDALVVKDKSNLPFVPGKTIKGLVREAAEEILSLANQREDKKEIFCLVFGNSEDRNNLDNTEEMVSKARQGVAFFTNAELPESQQTFINEKKLASFLYRSTSSTAIDSETGIAKEHSLRRMETTVPCVLEGRILNVPINFEKDIVDALSYIKRLGQNRNRGLGRCDIKILEGGRL